MTAIQPRKGLRFLHTRYQEEVWPTNDDVTDSVLQPMMFEVTRVAQDTVYYAPIQNGIRGKTKDYCSVADFPKYVKQIVES